MRKFTPIREDPTLRFKEEVKIGGVTIRAYVPKDLTPEQRQKNIDKCISIAQGIRQRLGI